MSILEVAREAGVSVATVSRVFNLPDKVAPATREHVENIARTLGYLPNASARTLRTQRSRVLGVVLPTLTNPVFAECLEGIAQAAVAGGYAILPFTTDYRLDQEDRAVNLLLAGNVDGMILVVSNPATSTALQRLAEVGLPYVLAYNQHPDHPCVSVNSEQAVADVVAHLATLGHRRIAMVSGLLSASDRAQQRCRGYARGMEQVGLRPQPVLQVPFVAAAPEVLGEALSSPDRPTALVCSNDLLAIRSIRAAHLAGLAVPRDLSVVGFDGIALGQDLTPQLSTVVQPNADIGRHSVELLAQAVASGSPLGPDMGLTLAHQFRTGESCSPPSPSLVPPLT
ncbi:MAG: LacI family DNA-binding transcriptional regulator [Acidovorax sp.]|nr:LacI family DNA-binding transcriptional regulator [Acidovorax sp.]